MEDLTAANLDARVEEAQFRAARVTAFLKRFPRMETDPADTLPSIGWDQIERQLRNLAGPDFERASWELRTLKAMARSHPPEMVYRELFTLAWSLIDDTRPARVKEGDMD